MNNENICRHNSPDREIMRAAASARNCERTPVSTCDARQDPTGDLERDLDPTLVANRTVARSTVTTEDPGNQATRETVEPTVVASPRTEATGTNTIENPTVASTNAAVAVIPTVATGQLEATVETYWEPRPTSRAEDLKLFLRLFEPASGALSKRKPEQWAFIMDKILPRLSEAAFIAKQLEIKRRLNVAGAELKELSEADEELDEEDVDARDRRSNRRID